MNIVSVALAIFLSRLSGLSVGLIHCWQGSATRSRSSVRRRCRRQPFRPEPAGLSPNRSGLRLIPRAHPVGRPADFQVLVTARVVGLTRPGWKWVPPARAPSPPTLHRWPERRACGSGRRSIQCRESARMSVAREGGGAIVVVSYVALRASAKMPSSTRPRLVMNVPIHILVVLLWAENGAGRSCHSRNLG